MSDDILFTPEEIAGRLKITKNTVYEMIKRGDIDAHRIGKHLRISATQYEVFLLKSKGSENIFEATVLLENGETVARIGPVDIRVNTDLLGVCRIAIRPEDIILSVGTFKSSARNVHKGLVTAIYTDENSAKVILDIGIPLAVLITKKSLSEMDINKGSVLYAVFKTMAVRVYRWRIGTELV